MKWVHQEGLGNKRVQGKFIGRMVTNESFRARMRGSGKILSNGSCFSVSFTKYKGSRKVY